MKDEYVYSCVLQDSPRNVSVRFVRLVNERAGKQHCIVAAIMQHTMKQTSSFRPVMWHAQTAEYHCKGDLKLQATLKLIYSWLCNN